MARDRLAALRAQQQASYYGADRWSYPSQDTSRLDQIRPPDPCAQPYTGRYGQYDSSGARWSYPSQDGAGRVYQIHLPNPYDQPAGRYQAPSVSRAEQIHLPNPYDQAPGHYQTQGVRNGTGIPNVGYSHDDMTTFYAEISTIQDGLRTFNDNVSRISDLHSRSLNSMDWASSRRNASQLEGLVKETSTLSNQLKNRIKKLHTKNVSGRDAHIRRQQTGLVKHKFVEAIQNYQQVEHQYRSKYKQRMERQFKVVKPDATPEEVKAVVDVNQGGQIFTEMLQSSNRYGASRAAFREVRERHEDVKKIERTLGELAQLFNDMNILVAQEGETIDEIEAIAMNIEKNAEIGLRQTDKAISSARSRRKKQWICVGIVLILLGCFGIAMGVLAAELSQNNN